MKQRVRRLNIILFVVLVVPFTIFCLVTVLGLMLSWPAWVNYIALGILLVDMFVSTRFLKPRITAMMHELPIRDADAPYDPEAPSVSTLELQRYERAQAAMSSSTTWIIGVVPLGVLILLYVSQAALPAEGTLAAMFFLAGFAIAFGERMVARTQAITQRNLDEAQYHPSWWNRVQPLMTSMRRILIGAFAVLVLVATILIPWLGGSLLAGSVIGWFVTQRVLTRFQQRIDIVAGI